MTASPPFSDADIDGALALALLEWQCEMGADEAMLDVPTNRLEPAPAAAPVAGRIAQDGDGARPSRPAPAPFQAQSQARPQVPSQASSQAPHGGGFDGGFDGGMLDVGGSGGARDVVAEAQALAAGADTLEELAVAQSAFDGIALKRGARNFVFCDGNPAARLMVIGEAPGEEEDAQGRPFVGRAGRLLDQMLAAIGLGRDAPDPDRAVYISNVITWRPPGNRRPEAGEIAASLPFLARHVELAAPEMIVLMGNTPCQAVLGRTGITRMRGQWTEAFGCPALPMLHPAYLLRTPLAKREAWADWLDVAARLGL